MFDCILFDLDGTLTDSFEGISNAIIYALKKFGIEVCDKQKLISFIGPPLDESFKKYYGFDEEKAKLAIKYYREYYSVTGMYEGTVYEGVYTLLSELKKQGKKLIIATSKPEEYVLKILKRFELFDYFDFVAGATLNYSRVNKADVISYAVKSCNVNVNTALMVGDRHHDISGAKANGIKSVGVLYGFGDREELEKAGADYIINSPEELFLKIEI